MSIFIITTILMILMYVDIYNKGYYVSYKWNMFAFVFYFMANIKVFL